MSNKIKIIVPASTANLGPGFDTLALALDWCNEFTFQESKSGLVIQSSVENKLPADATNLVYQSFCYAFSMVDKTPPALEINIESNIPLASGLGSSSTAVVAGLFAANHFMNGKFSLSKIFSLATKIEGHSDNCAAAIFGGLTASISVGEDAYVSRLEWPLDLKIIIANPDFSLSTAISRELLPPKVQFTDATFNVGRTAFLLSKLVNKDYDNLIYAFEDTLHQQYRKDLIPGMEEVIKSAITNGALGASLSGAGPTLVAFSNNESKTKEIELAMKNTWKDFNVNANTKIVNVNLTGTRIITL